MDDDIVKQDQEKLDHLEDEIKQAEHDLDEEKGQPGGPHFYDEGGEEEGPMGG